jgi:protein-S-isoprenylcysteine O-methyltransferase Ste14
LEARSQSSPGATLTANVLVNAVYYGVTVVLFPALILFLETRLGFDELFERRPVAALLCAVAAIVLQAWCLIVFHRLGRGTASPVVPTTELVTAGPYRVIRNPLNVGEVLLFVALALWFGSPGLAVYALLSAVAFHLFIVGFEEPRLAARYGNVYADYRARVNRWLPRFTALPRP